MQKAPGDDVEAGSAQEAAPEGGDVVEMNEIGHRIALEEVFHRANNVLLDEQIVRSIDPDSTCGEAIEIMLAHGYSQLPVVRSGEVLGSFSFRSFAVIAVDNPWRTPLKDMPVEEFLEQLHIAHSDAELSSLYASLDSDDAVLIGSQNDLQAILTPADVRKYLEGLTEPFVQLGEIERCLRAVVKYALAPAELEECVNRVLRIRYAGREQELPATVEAMTLSEIIDVIGNKHNFSAFAPLLGPRREIFTTRFSQLGNLRNVVSHFKRDLSDEERQRIAGARSWLLRKLRGSGATL
ncbi:CBS domain protein [Kribbella sp. VKM Ac-2569]|nr:CBS domain protein [Kribbella sp. VKM Ac-2569]